MVKCKEFVEFKMSSLPIKKIETKELFTAVIIKLLYIKKKYPDLPKVGTTDFDEMMYLYGLFNEYVDRTGVTEFELPKEFVDDLNLPQSAITNSEHCV